jgi:hypothetical protein
MAETSSILVIRFDASNLYAFLPFCIPSHFRAIHHSPGLIAAYHTKPAVKSFDGRPMREMLALRQEVKKRTKPPKPQPSGLDGLIGGLPLWY